MKPGVRIERANAGSDLAAARGLFQEYAAALDVSLCFQAFDEELANLPGEYAAPRGALLLGWVGDQAAACCGLRPLDAVDHPNAAEMKRLFVRPAFRRLGLGRDLADAALSAARTLGYSCVLLDTLDDMEAARTLYQDLGFFEIEPYYFNPIAGAHYLKVVL